MRRDSGQLSPRDGRSEQRERDSRYVHHQIDSVVGFRGRTTSCLSLG